MAGTQEPTLLVSVRFTSDQIRAIDAYAEERKLPRAVAVREAVLNWLTYEKAIEEGVIGGP